MLPECDDGTTRRRNGPREKDCFDEPPKPTRGTRPLPRAAKADNETTGQLTTGPAEGREQRAKKTPNAERPTSNVQLRQKFEQKETKIQKSVSVGHRNQHARRVCYPSTLNSHLSRRSFNEGATIN